MDEYTFAKNACILHTFPFVRTNINVEATTERDTVSYFYFIPGIS